MKLFTATIGGLAALLLTSTQALADGWELSPATNDQALQLTYSTEQGPAYQFTCGASEVSITNFGVTELLDVQTGQKVADEPGSVMTPGASVMTLYTGKGEPDFVAAEAVPNAVKGWDMTIRLSKDDKQLKSMERTDFISLFTTGYTMAVKMDRALARDFLKQCRLASPGGN